MRKSRRTGTMLAGVIMGAVAPCAVADIGFKTGVAVWNADISGETQSGGNSLDMQNNLGLGDEPELRAFVTVDPPLPLVPAFRLQYTTLDQDGEGQVTTSYLGNTFTGNVRSEVDLTHYDGLLYWQLLDNWVALDLGLIVRQFDGQLVITGDTAGGRGTSSADIDELLPMLYVSAGFDLPLSGLGFQVELAGVGLDDNSLIETTARFGYNFGNLGVEAGWHEMRLELDDVSDINADIDIGGPFLGINFNF